MSALGKVINQHFMFLADSHNSYFQNIFYPFYFVVLVYSWKVRWGEVRLLFNSGGSAWYKRVGERRSSLFSSETQHNSVFPRFTDDHIDNNFRICHLHFGIMQRPVKGKIIPIDKYDNLGYYYRKTCETTNHKHVPNCLIYQKIII